MKEKLLKLIKEETDMCAYNEILNSNYSVIELAEILATLIKFNEMEGE